jgi:hypothetical protein
MHFKVGVQEHHAPQISDPFIDTITTKQCYIQNTTNHIIFQSCNKRSIEIASGVGTTAQHIPFCFEGTHSWWQRVFNSFDRRCKTHISCCPNIRIGKTQSHPGHPNLWSVLHHHLIRWLIQLNMHNTWNLWHRFKHTLAALCSKLPYTPSSIFYGTI